MKRLLIPFAIVAAAGAIMAIGFLVASGLQYREREDLGLDPGQAPYWTVVGTELGLGVFVLGVVGLVVVGGVEVSRSARKARARR